LSVADLRTATNERPGQGAVIGGPEAAKMVADPDGQTEAPAAAAPSRLEFLGARPNPFRGSTEIQFALPRAMDVTIQVHDLSGRLVRTVLQGEIGAGTHGVTWDGRNDAGLQAGAGVYFTTFRAGDLYKTEKVFLYR